MEKLKSKLQCPTLPAEIHHTAQTALLFLHTLSLVVCTAILFCQHFKPTVHSALCPRRTDILGTLWLVQCNCLAYYNGSTRNGTSLCVHTTLILCAHHSLRGFVVAEDVHLSQVTTQVQFNDSQKLAAEKRKCKPIFGVFFQKPWIGAAITNVNTRTPSRSDNSFAFAKFGGEESIHRMLETQKIFNIEGKTIFLWLVTIYGILPRLTD